MKSGDQLKAGSKHKSRTSKTSAAGSKAASPSGKYVVGVDLGGTKILAGVFDAALNCLGRAKVSTKAHRGLAVVIDRAARCVRDAVDECDLELRHILGAGIGAPGASDPETGRVIFAPNLPGWRNVPLKKELERRLGIPVSVENDCNIQTLGVYQKEFRAKPRHLVGIFLGTGIGAGLVLDGKLHSGWNRTAGEIGHMVLKTDGPMCGCGNRGCFEVLASRNGILQRLQSGLEKGHKSSLADALGPDMRNARSGDLKKALKRGDRSVAKAVDQAAVYTGIAVANVINLLNPEVIVLGGGVMDALEERMLPRITETAAKYAMKGTAQGIKIVASKLGDDAGITGGAVLAWRHAG
jgi:glucokinase